MTVDGFKSHQPDAHGQAALLLAESMLHGLIARAVVPLGEAIEMVEIAMDAQAQIADSGMENSRDRRDALELLAEIRLSLEHDLPDLPGAPS